VPFQAGKSDSRTLVSRDGVLSPRLEEHPLNNEVLDVIKRCVEKEPSERPTMQDVVEIMMAVSRYGSPGSSIYPETPQASPLLVPSSTSGAMVRRLFNDFASNVFDCLSASCIR